MDIGSRTAEFCGAVRARDGRCAISGEVVPRAQYGQW